MNNNNSADVAKKFMVHGKTKLINGTILTPELAGLRLIMTAASETGKPEDELYTLLDKKWKTAKTEFKGWYQHHVNFKLGNVHTTAVQSDTWIVHCLFLNKDGDVDEKALASCMKKMCETAKSERGSVHVSTLLTGSIPNLVDLLQEYLVEKGVNVYFYEESKDKK